MLFVTIYMAGFLTLTGLGSWFYLRKELRRIDTEQSTATALREAQCDRLMRFAPPGFACTLPSPDLTGARSTLYRDVGISVALAVTFALGISVLLGYVSLRPMRQAARRMDRFIETVIHDVNTPVAAARLNVEALDGLCTDVKMQRRLERISRSLDQLAALRSQLQEGMAASQLTFNDTDFDLAALMHELATRSELIRVTGDAAFIIHADRTMIARLIDNLLSNALKYNRKSAPVDLILEATCLQVRDRGQGIADVSRVFERYYRESSSMPGYGLGLGIVKSIAAHYGLVLSMQSEVGVGTTVTIDFGPVDKKKLML